MKYSDLILKDYLRTWNIRTLKDIKKAFQNKVFNMFLNKTSKNFIRNILLRKFKRWQLGSIKDKNNANYLNGLPILQRAMYKHCFKYIIPYLNDSSNGLKSKSVKSLLMKFPKMRLNILRYYMKKYAKLCSKMRTVELSSQILKQLGKKNSNKYILKLINNKFQTWKNKVNMLIYLDAELKNGHDRRKILASSKINNLLHLYCRRIAESVAFPQLLKHLVNSVKSKAVKKIVGLHPKLNRILIRKIFIKWIEIISRLKINDFRNKVFFQIAKNVHTSFNRYFLKKGFSTWFNNCPKNTAIKILNGYDSLINGIRRKYLGTIVKGMGQKIDRDNLRDKLLKKLKKKDFQLNNVFKTYFYKWNKLTDSYNTKTLKNNLTAKFLLNNRDKYARQFICKRFNFWRKLITIKRQLVKTYEKTKRLVIETQNYCIHNLKDYKKVFLERIKITKSNSYIKISMNKLIEYAFHSHLLRMRTFYNLWRLKLKDLKIRFLKEKLWKFRFINYEVTNEKTKQLNAMKIWANTVKIYHIFKTNNLNLNKTMGFNILFNQARKRRFQAFNKVKELMRLDNRGKLVFLVFKKINRPKYEIGRCLEKWIRVNNLYKDTEKIKSLLHKLLFGSCKKMSTRIFNEFKLRCWNKWRGLAINFKEKYFRKIDAINILQKYLIRNFCRKGFTMIDESTNYKKIALKFLPKSSKFMKKMNLKIMLKRWMEWRKYTHTKINDDLISKIISNLSKSTHNKTKQFITTKFFKLWRNKCFSQLNKRLIPLTQAVKGLKIMTHTFEEKYMPNFFKRFKNWATKKLIDKFLFKSLSKMRAHWTKKLKNYLLYWWKINLIDGVILVNNNNILLKSIRRMIITNYILKPTEKYFMKWQKNMEASYKQIEKGAKLLNQAMVKKHRNPCFCKIKDYVSTKVLERSLRDKVIKKGNKLFEAFRKNSMYLTLAKWKRLTDKKKLKNLNLKIYQFLYKKKIDVLTRKFLKKWQRINKILKKDEKKKPVNHGFLKKGESIFFKTLVNRLLGRNFMTKLKEYSQFKFLRSLFLRNSKFHRKNLRVFLLRWKSITDKIIAKILQARLYGKLLARMAHYHQNNLILSHLKIRLFKWRDFKNFILKKIPIDINKAIHKIKHANLIKNFPYFKEKLLHIKMRHIRNSILFDRMKKHGAMEKFILKEFIRRWQDYLKRCLLRYMRQKVMSVYLKNYQIRVNKMALKNRFTQWKDFDPTVNEDENMHKDIGLNPSFNLKTRAEREKILTCVTVASKILLTCFKRIYFAIINQKTHLLNRKVPDNMSFTKALLNGDLGLCKNVAIKSILMRQRLRRWKEFIEYCRTKELIDKTSHKILKKRKINTLVLMRKSFAQWKEFVNFCKVKETETEFYTKIMLMINSKNQRFSLLKRLNHWKDVQNKYIIDLGKIYKGLTRLRNYFTREHFIKLNDNVQAIFHFKIKKARIINTFKMMVLCSESGKKLYFFNKFKNACEKINTLIFKHHVAKYIINKYENSTIMRMKNKLHEKLLRWYFHTCPKIVLERISYVVTATKRLKSGLIKIIGDHVLERIRLKAIRVLVLEMIMKWSSKWDKKAENMIMKKKFDHWNNLVIAKRKARMSMYDLFSKYNQSPGIRQEKFGPLLRLRKFIYKAMETKISGIIKIQRQFKKLKSNSKKNKINNLLIALWRKYNNKQKACFRIWRKPVLLNLFANSAVVLQKFIRKSIERLRRLRFRTGKFVKAVNTDFQQKIFNKLKTFAKLMHKRKLCFDKWRFHFFFYRKVNAANAFNAVIRGFLTRRFVKVLLYRKTRLNDVVTKLFSKHLEKKKLYFNNWRFVSKITGNNTAAEILQDYIRKRIELTKYIRAHRQIKSLFKKYVTWSITNCLSKLSQTNHNRGYIMFRLIEKNLRDCFNRVKEYSRKRGQYLCLLSFYPRLIESMRMYWSLFYVRKWKKTVDEYKLNKLILLQNKIKGKLKLWKLKTELRKYHLLEKYAFKLSHESKFIGRVFLKIWNKKARYLSMLKASNTVQSIWNGTTSRKNAERQVSKIKLKNLFRKLFINNTRNQFSKLGDFADLLRTNLNKFNKQFENRYSTNNLINQANDSIRNGFLYQITKKKYYLDSLSFKKQYFTRWKKISLKYDDQSKILQSKYRQFRAKKLLEMLLNIKKKLMALIKKHIDSNQQKMYYYLLKWKVINENYLMNFSSKTLQKYIRLKLIKKRLIKTQRFFNLGENALVAKRINNLVRMQFLKKRLTFPKYRKFLHSLKKLCTRLKFRDIVLKRFFKSDENLKNEYLKSVIQLWNKQTHRINAKRLESSIIIQSAFRKYKIRKLLNSLIDKKGRYLKLVLKLTNQMEIKRGVYFQLWMKLSNKNKYEFASRVLQNYMNYIQDKINRKKTYIKFKNNYNGFMTMKSLYDSITRESFKKLLLYSKHKRIINLMSLLMKIEYSGVKLGFEKINQLATIIRDYKLKKVNKIRDIWKMYQKRTSIMGILYKFKKLRNLMFLMMDKNLRLLNMCYNLWNRNVKMMNVKDAIHKINDFLDKRVGPQMSSFITLARNALKYLFTTRRDKNIKDIKKMAQFERLNLLTMKTIFKSFINKIDIHMKMTYMNKLFRLPKSVIDRMLSSSIKKWFGNLKLFEEEENRVRNFHTKRAKMWDSLTKHFENLYEKYEEKKRLYYHIWCSYTKQKKITDSANIINDWLSNKYKKFKLKQKWEKLYMNYCMRHHIYQILHINNRMKQFIRLRKIYSIFDTKLKILGLNQLILKVHLRRVMKKFKIILSDTNHAEQNMKLLYFWSRWRHVVSHFRLQDAALLKTKHIIETRQQIDDFRILYHTFTIKKMNILFNAIDKRRQFDKIKSLSVKNNNFLKLGQIINKCAKEIQLVETKEYLSNLFKIYKLKILDKFHRRYNLLEEKVKKDGFETLIKNLKQLIFENSKFTYQNDKKHIIKANNIYSTNFSSKISDEGLEESVKAGQMTKKNEIQFYIPFLVNYLQMLLNERKRFSLYKLTPLQKMSKFMQIVNNYCEKLNICEKKNYINLLFDCLQLDNIKNRLKSLLRKYRLFRYKEETFKPTAKFIRLLYFIRVAAMHNETADMSFLILLIRNWKFACFIHKAQKSKLEAIYKQMQSSYLSIAQGIFGSQEEEMSESQSSASGSASSSGGFAFEMRNLSGKLGVFTKRNFSSASSKKYYQFTDLIKLDGFGHLIMDDQDEIAEISQNKSNNITSTSPGKNNESEKKVLKDKSSNSSTKQRVIIS